MDWQTHSTRLVHDRPFYALPYPPCRIGRETETARWLKFFYRMHQTKIAFLNQVQQWHAAIQIALCDADHEPQITLYHDLPRLELALARKYRIILLFLRRQERFDANPIQIVLNRVGSKLSVQQSAKIVGVGVGIGIAYRLAPLYIGRLLDFVGLLARGFAIAALDFGKIDHQRSIHHSSAGSGLRVPANLSREQNGYRFVNTHSRYARLMTKTYAAHRFVFQI
jgi:hypothetical protein